MKKERLLSSSLRDLGSSGAPATISSIIHVPGSALPTPHTLFSCRYIDTFATPELEAVKRVSGARLLFDSESTPLVLKRVNDDGLASEFPEVREGLELTHIQGESAKKMNYREALAKMKSIRRSTRPLVLSFVVPTFKEHDVWAGTASRFEESSSDSDSEDDVEYVPSHRRR